MARNPGKLFEEDFKASVPADVYYYRLRDSATGWGGSEGPARFTPSNDYDCILYRAPHLYCLELKSVAGRSIRYDALREKQLSGLSRAAGFEETVAGVVVNFRGAGVTAFVPIALWIYWSAASSKKSFNVSELLSWRDHYLHPTIIEGSQRVTRWRYDLDSFVKGRS